MKRITTKLKFGRQYTHPQYSSPIFLLPLEIRLIIYQLVVNTWELGSKIHVTTSFLRRDREDSDRPEKGLTCFACIAHKAQESAGFNSRNELINQWPINTLNLGCHECCKKDIERYHDYGRVRSGIGCFLACRRLYEEAMPFLYSSFSFDLWGEAVPLFLRAVPSSSLQYIRSLGIVWILSKPEKNKKEEKRWPRSCERIKEITDLESLRVRLYYQDGTFAVAGPPLKETNLLEPLRNIKIPEEEFIVELPWADGWKRGDGLLGASSIPEDRLRCTIKRRNELPQRRSVVRTEPCRGKRRSPWKVYMDYTVNVICLPVIVCVVIWNILADDVPERRAKAREKEETQMFREVKRRIAVSEREWREAGCPPGREEWEVKERSMEI